MRMPTNIAMPTEMPTRCPTPTSAKDRLADIPVEPRPTRKYTAASSTTRRVWLKAKNAADATELTAIAASPWRLSSVAVARLVAHQEHLGRRAPFRVRANRC